MKKIISATLLALFLSAGLVGCGDYSNIKTLTRAETIAAVKECEDGGMKALLREHGITGQLFDIRCVPKETAN